MSGPLGCLDGWAQLGSHRAALLPPAYEAENDGQPGHECRRVRTHLDRLLHEARHEGEDEDRQPGGLGISLVRRLVRRMDYERRDGVNVITIEIPRN